MEDISSCLKPKGSWSFTAETIASSGNRGVASRLLPKICGFFRERGHLSRQCMADLLSLVCLNSLVPILQATRGWLWFLATVPLGITGVSRQKHHCCCRTMLSHPSPGKPGEAYSKTALHSVQGLPRTLREKIQADLLAFSESLGSSAHYLLLLEISLSNSEYIPRLKFWGLGRKTIPD